MCFIEARVWQTLGASGICWSNQKSWISISVLGDWRSFGSSMELRDSPLVFLILKECQYLLVFKLIFWTYVVVSMQPSLPTLWFAKIKIPKWKWPSLRFYSHFWHKIKHNREDLRISHGVHFEMKHCFPMTHSMLLTMGLVNLPWQNFFPRIIS